MIHEVDVARAAPPAVPGLLLDRLLGAGRYGPVWQGLDLAAGGPVAVTVGRAAPDAWSAACEAALLRRLDHENVVRMRSMVDLPGGARAVVCDLAAGGSLAGLVDRRGELPEAEAATVAAGVARGLAHVHARGFVHGALTPREVLFDAAGRPGLSGVGTRALLVPVAGAPHEPVYPAPADDVAALGEILRHVLLGGVPGLPGPGPLTAVVTACLAPEPADRPTAEQVARLVLEAVAPEPVALLAPHLQAPTSKTRSRPDSPAQPAVGAPVGGVPPPIARRAAAAAEGRLDELGGPDALGRGRRRAMVGRLLAVAGAGVTGFALLAGALVLALRHGDAPARPVGRPVAAPPPDVPSLVALLAAGRAGALTAGSEAALSVVDAPGSPAMAADTALVRRMRASGVHLSGLAFPVSGVRVLSSGAGGTTVEARVSTSAYQRVRADASVEKQVPAAPARTVQLTLVATAAGWRIGTAS